MFPPRRIVCLTEETVETLYLLGEEHRIVGVSGYAVRPARVRKEKPRVSAFISTDFDKVLALEPDLVLTFSDLQADIAAELIRRNVAVHAFNQRDIAGILAMVRTLGALVGAAAKAEALAQSLERRLSDVAAARRTAVATPAGLFRGMGRADDLRHPLGRRIDRDGGRHRSVSRALGAQERQGPHRLRRRRDRRAARHHRRLVVRQEIRARRRSRPAPGFDRVPAVRDGFLREIKSPLILQPGPAALTDGLDALAAIVAEWSAQPRLTSRYGLPASRVTTSVK